MKLLFSLCVSLLSASYASEHCQTINTANMTFNVHALACAQYQQNRLILLADKAFCCDEDYKQSNQLSTLECDRIRTELIKAHTAMLQSIQKI